MEKKDYNYNMIENVDKRRWADSQFNYHTDLFFAIKAGFEEFKKEVCDEEGNVDFNKYIPCDPKNPSDVLESWGSFEAHHCIVDNEVNTIHFNTFLDVPMCFIETWSKNHPEHGFVALFAYDNDSINETSYSTVYKGEPLKTFWYKQNCVSEREFKKNPDAAWDKFMKEYWYGYVYPHCYEELQKVCPEIKLGED